MHDYDSSALEKFAIFDCLVKKQSKSCYFRLLGLIVVEEFANLLFSFAILKDSVKVFMIHVIEGMLNQMLHSNVLTVEHCSEIKII